MARYARATCRLCRGEGIKLFLKGDGCYIDKYAFVRRSYVPGRHKAAKRKLSNYGTQLRGKQEVRRIYGVSESQFRAYYGKTDHVGDITDENLLKLLKMRLGSVVYRPGYGAPGTEARQLVNCGHLLVSDKKVDIPSYRISVNDEIIVTKKNRGTEKLGTFIENPGTLPEWLEANVEDYSGRVITEPSRESIDIPVNETLITKLYSK